MINPHGNANSMATPVTSSVPQTKGQIPKCFSAPSSGLHVVPVRNSTMLTSGLSKNFHVSRASTMMIAAVVSIVSPPQVTSDVRTQRSQASRRRVDLNRIVPEITGEF